MAEKNNYCILFLSLVFFLSGCTMHKSTMQGSRCNGKCNYQAIAIGTCEKMQILGIGGNNSDAMLFEAKRNLYRAFPLRKGEFFDNFIVDYKTTCYLFFQKSLVTVTADIVIENVAGNEQLFSDNYIQALNSGKIKSYDHIQLSDSVIYLSGGRLHRGVVLDFEDKNAKVLVNNPVGNHEVQRIPIKKLFTIDNEDIEELTGYEAGQILEISSGGTKDEGTVVKKVTGLRVSRILVAHTSNKKTTYTVVELDKDR